jgi:hypothetical protein
MIADGSEKVSYIQGVGGLGHPRFDFQDYDSWIFNSPIKK